MATTTDPATSPDREADVLAPRADVSDREAARVHKLARILDHFFVDPILGFLVPGAGDIAGSLLGLYTVGVAIRRRLSPVIIARMLMNLAVDGAIGLIPLVGDIFDLGHKANAKNAKLLETRTRGGGRASWRDWLAVVGALVAFLGAIALAVYAIVAVVRRIG